MNFWKDAHRVHKSGLLCVCVGRRGMGSEGVGKAGESFLQGTFMC